MAMESSIKPHASSASKLPIKRKTHPNDAVSHHSSADAPPPFKYHRIWTEGDEIRFLQGLLDSSANLGLSFPRDLSVFYDRFSESMPQPYSRSQLSEKLRRLRKKFRSLSSRSPSSLSPHDLSLFLLSERLWSPRFASSSPFFLTATTTTCPGNASDARKIETFWVGNANGTTATASCASDASKIGTLLAVNDSDTRHHSSTSNPCASNARKIGTLLVGGDVDEPPLCVLPNVSGSEDDDGDVKVDVGGRGGEGAGVGGIGGAVARSVVDVFDEALGEVRRVVKQGGSMEEKERDFEWRWREQRVREVEVLARRLRLVLENSFCGL